MFRKVLNLSINRTARFYIPFCPRPYDRFNYNEFTSKLITGSKHANISDNDRQYIADKIIELREYADYKINYPTKFMDIVYSKESDHDFIGYVVRVSSIMSLNLLFGAENMLPWAVYVTCSTLILVYNDTPFSQEFRQKIREIDSRLQVNQKSKEESNNILKESKIRDYLVEQMRN
jgi:hypothetical protein